MKIFLRSFALLFAAAFVLCGCNKVPIVDPPDPTEWSVTYSANNFFASDLKAPKTVTSANGETLEFTVTAALGYKFVGWSDGVETATRTDDSSVAGQILTAIFEYEYLDLPVVIIETEENAPIVSKEEYLSCAVSVSGAEEKFCMTGVEAQVRGRGTSSWNLMPKKSYRLKFSKKTDFFGNGKAKNWALIANYDDKSLMRNSLAYALGREFEDSLYTTTTQFIDLYVNGEYLGVYLVCEQTEAGSTRVDVEDLAENPEDSGYLIEMDGDYYDDVEITNEFFVMDGKMYTIKDPDWEDEEFTDAHKQYIMDYTATAYAALLSEDYELVRSLIDVGSFADTYVVSELFNNVDCGDRSVFFYKKAGGVLCSGPIWDFDVSAGNVDYKEGAELPESLYASGASEWYRRLLAFEEFRTLVTEKIERYYEPFCTIIENEIEGAKGMKASAERNFEKWQIMGEYVWPNSPEIVAIDTWEGQLDYLKEWLLKSWDFIYETYVTE